MLKNSNNKQIVDVFVNQAVGGQSMLRSIFHKVLKVSSDKMINKELTYFTLSALFYVYLRLDKSKDKEIISDDVALAVLSKSLPYFGEDISIKQSIMEYQKRYREYDALMQLIFKEEGPDGDSCISLSIHVYESVMNESAMGSNILISPFSSMITQYIVDMVEFVKINICESNQD